MRLRRSARVFLFDENDSLLLIRFKAMRSDGLFVFWVTPGGEIESARVISRPQSANYSKSLACVYRLLARCIGKRVGRTSTSARWCGISMSSSQRGAKHDEPRLMGVTEDEIALMQETRWWTLAEVAASTENLYPVALAEKARKALRLLPGAA